VTRNVLGESRTPMFRTSRRWFTSKFSCSNRTCQAKQDRVDVL